MSRLSKVDSYAIKWLAHTGLTPSEISKELKLSEEQIMKVLEKEAPLTNTDKVKTGSSPVKQEKTLMINQTAVKKNKSVSVMTEAASQQNDQELKKPRSAIKHNKDIFRPHSQ